MAVVVVVAGSVWLLASWREELQSSLLFSSGTSDSDTEGGTECGEDVVTPAQKTEAKNIPLKSLIEYSRKTHEDPRMKVNAEHLCPRCLNNSFHGCLWVKWVICPICPSRIASD